MARRLLKNLKAEEDANRIAERYIGSANVLADMQRDYGGALSGVRIHDDAAAAQRLDGVGRDGLAVGNDIFMRPGLVNSGLPEANGLLAHELSHVMQQGSGSVAYGSEQGGLLDWFRGLGGKKKKKKKPEERYQETDEDGNRMLNGRYLTEGDIYNEETYETESPLVKYTPEPESRSGGFINWIRGFFSRSKKAGKGRQTGHAGLGITASVMPALASMSVGDINRPGMRERISRSATTTATAASGSSASATADTGQIREIEDSLKDIDRISSSSELSRKQSDASLSDSSHSQSSSSTAESMESASGETTESDWADEFEMIYSPYRGQEIDPKRIGKVNLDRNIADWKEDTAKSRGNRRGTEGLIAEAERRYGDINYDIGNASYFEAENKAMEKAKASGKQFDKVDMNDDMIHIGGLNLIRILSGLLGVTGEDLSNEEILTLVGQLNSGKQISADEEGNFSSEQIAEKDAAFDQGMEKLKDLYYGQLKKLEATYGKMPTQLHPDDFLRQIPDWDTFVQNAQMVQDIQQMMTSASKYFDFENNPKDKEMKDLQDYYFYMVSYYTSYVKQGLYSVNEETNDLVQKANPEMLEVGTNGMREMMLPAESGVKYGPQFNKKEYQEYLKKLKSRAAKQGWQDRLFGIYK